MAKVSKEFTWRMQGMSYAYKIAKEQGIEVLEADIKARNFYRAPIKFSVKEINEFRDFVCENLYHTMLTAVFMVLHDKLGFRKKRLLDFKEEINKVAMSAFDFSIIGNHYVTLEDYAVYLNEKADLGLDVARVAACQANNDYEKEWKNMANVDELVKVLREEGFEDASKWLEGRIVR